MGSGYGQAGSRGPILRRRTAEGGRLPHRKCKSYNYRAHGRLAIRLLFVITTDMRIARFTAGMQRREEVVAIDFGYQITKATHLKRSGSGFRIVKYVLRDTPIDENIP